jgi:hypothetical protein
MSIILTHRHFLVYPDGLVQELEWTPQDEMKVGDLIGAEHVQATIEPSGKYIVTRITDEDPGEYPHARKYYLEPF